MFVVLSDNIPLMLGLAQIILDLPMVRKETDRHEPLAVAEIFASPFDVVGVAVGSFLASLAVILDVLAAMVAISCDTLLSPDSFFRFVDPVFSESLLASVR